MASMLAISYHHQVTDARKSLESRSARALDEVSVLLVEAEVVLTRIASALEVGDAQMLHHLQSAVYKSAYFREAGIINEEGFLVLTNLGPVDPPVSVDIEHRSNPGTKSLQLKGPLQTTVMRERSIILSLPTRGEGEVNLLVNPNLLLYFLDIVDQTNLGPDGFIAFVNSTGDIVVADGALAQSGKIKALEDGGERTRVTLETPDGLLKVIGEISDSWVLRHWITQAYVGVPLAILSVFVLFSIFFLFFRRFQPYDQDLRTGLRDNEFELHYQPIVDIRDGSCAGVEALIRWRHPEEGVLLPGLFIPSAEKTGLINPLGNWVVRQVVKDLDGFFDRYPLRYVSVNLSPIQLNSGRLEDTIKWLHEAPLPLESLVFEVTEQAMIREAQTTAMDTLARIRKLGCGVALDDFGTGYSSLSNLTKFEFGFLKIDQQFIQGVNQDIRTNSILESMVELGQKLGVSVIAEGVETQEQRDYLHKLGVTYAQGWLFSIPLPVNEFEDYLSDHQGIDN